MAISSLSQRFIARRDYPRAPSKSSSTPVKALSHYLPPQGVRLGFKEREVFDNRLRSLFLSESIKHRENAKEIWISASAEERFRIINLLLAKYYRKHSGAEIKSFGMRAQVVAASVARRLCDLVGEFGAPIELAVEECHTRGQLKIVQGGPESVYPFNNRLIEHTHPFWKRYGTEWIQDTTGDELAYGYGFPSLIDLDLVSSNFYHEAESHRVLHPFSGAFMFHDSHNKRVTILFGVNWKNFKVAETPGIDRDIELLKFCLQDRTIQANNADPRVNHQLVQLAMLQEFFRDAIEWGKEKGLEIRIKALSYPEIVKRNRVAIHEAMRRNPLS